MSALSEGNTYLLRTTTSDLIGLLVAFGIQILLAIGLFTLFSFIRATVPSVYSPKSFYKSARHRPPKLNDGFFSWILPTIRWNQKNEIDIIGLDLFMYLRFLKFLCEYFAGLAILAIPLIIFNYYAPWIAGLPIDEFLDKNPEIKNSTEAANSTSYEDLLLKLNPRLNWLTMENLQPESKWFYLYTFAAYIFSFYGYYLVFTMWVEYVELRRQWFSSDAYKNQRHHRTLLITNLPPTMRSETAVAKIIEAVDPAQPSQIMLGRHYEELEELIKEHSNATISMEKYVNDCKHLLLLNPIDLNSTNPTERRPLIFPNGLWSIMHCDRVDAIDHYKDELHQLEVRIYELRCKDDESFRPDSSAFILYPSLSTAHRVAHEASWKLKLRTKMKRFSVPKIKLCPQFEDIIWKNLGYRPSYRRARRLFSFFLSVSIIILWTLLLTVIITLTNLDYLNSVHPEIGQSEFTVILIQYILAPALLVILNYSVLPIILRHITGFQGVLSKTGREKSTLNKFFTFQVYQTMYFIAISVIVRFIVVTYKGFDLIEFFKQYRLVLLVSMRAFVNASTFYITTILVGYGGYGVEILQGAPLLYKLIMRLFRLTPRQRHKLDRPPRFDYMLYYGTMLVPFMVALAYSVVAPLIVPFAFVLFVIVYVVMKYQMRYVYETRIESGGTWFRKLSGFICICMAMFQLLTVGAIALISGARSKTGNGRTQAILTAILPFITLFFWLSIDRILGPKAQFYSVPTSSPFDTESHAHADEDAVPLDNTLFDPVIVKPLMKVWVDLDQKLPTVYSTVYTDVDDFIESKGISPDPKTKIKMVARMVSLMTRHQEKIKHEAPVRFEPPEFTRLNAARITRGITEPNLRATVLRRLQQTTSPELIHQTTESPRDVPELDLRTAVLRTLQQSSSPDLLNRTNDETLPSKPE